MGPAVSTLGDKEPKSLATLRNVGHATLVDFHLLGITSVAQLATQEADKLYDRLCAVTAQRHDPCVRDVFSATIHEAKSGEPLNWWECTATRKARLAAAMQSQANAANIVSPRNLSND